MHVKVLFACNLYDKSKKQESFAWTWSYVADCWPNISIYWYRLPLGEAGSSKTVCFPVRHLVKPTATKDLKDSSFLMCLFSSRSQGLKDIQILKLPQSPTKESSSALVTTELLQYWRLPQVLGSPKCSWSS